MNAKWLQAPVLTAMLMAMVGTVFAQDDFFGLEGVDEEESEPWLSSYIEFGIAWLDDDAYRFGKYTGLTREGIVPLLDFTLVRRPAWDGTDTAYWRIDGRRMGFGARRLDMEVGNQGLQRFTLGYRQIPNRSLGGGATPFSGAGGSFMTLPTDWVATGASTGDMTLLDQFLQPLDIGHTRRRLDLGYSRVLDPAWTVDVDYRRETKEGTRAVGAAFGYTGGNPRAAVLPAPVDFVTDIFDVSLRHGGARHHVAFSYHGSMFDNRQTAFSWQNPFGQLGAWAPGVGYPDGLGRMSLEPENSFHQFRLDGAWRISAVTRVSADLAFGRMKQNEAFLPYTVNPALTVEEGLPRTSLDGRIDTTVFNLRLNSQPFPRLHVAAALRHDDRDNRTAQEAYRYIAGDSQHQRAASAARINLPYSYREQRFDLNAAYRMGGRMRLAGGYQYRDTKRDFSESAGAEEHTVRMGLRGAPTDTLMVSVDYRWSERDADPYDGRVPFVANHMPGTVDQDDFENHPLLRKYYLTDRDRDQIVGRVDWMVAPRVNVGLGAYHARDRYDDEFFGLNRGRVRNLNMDVGFDVSEAVNLSFWYSRDRYDSDQSARGFQSNPATVVDPDRNWWMSSHDRIDTSGVGIRMDDAGRRMGLERDLEIGADALWSRSRTAIDVTVAPLLTAAPLPDLYTRLVGVSLYARYHLSVATSWRLGLERERYSSRDFALDGVVPDTLGNVLGLGNPSPDYSVTLVSARFRHRF